MCLLVSIMCSKNTNSLTMIGALCKLLYSIKLYAFVAEYEKRLATQIFTITHTDFLQEQLVVNERIDYQRRNNG